MVQNVSPDSEDFISGNYYGVRALPRALRAVENEKNAGFCLYFECARRIFERAARAPQIFFSSCAPDILDAFCTLNENISLKTRIYNLKKALHAYMAIYAWSRGSEPKWDQQGRIFHSRRKF